MPTRTNLDYAFAAMRLRHIIARQNFRANTSQALKAISSYAAFLVRAGQSVKGCCFYSREDGLMQSQGGDFYLCYGPLFLPGEGCVGLSPCRVGKLVVRCLEQFQVGYLWSGDPDKRILVLQSSIRKMSSPEAKCCQWPGEAHYRFGDAARPYWMEFSTN